MGASKPYGLEVTYRGSRADVVRVHWYVDVSARGRAMVRFGRDHAVVSFRRVGA